MPLKPTSQQDFLKTLPPHEVFAMRMRWVGFKCRRTECRQPFLVRRAYVDANRGKPMSCPCCQYTGRIP